MTRDEHDALPVIMSFFPLTFKTGRQQWTEFTVECAECNNSIDPYLTRGIVDRETSYADPYRGGKSFTQYHIEAHALCPSCNKLTTAIYALDENMEITGINPKTGEMACWGTRRLTLWEKFMSWWKGDKK